MDDIFFATREGDEKFVREWLANNENDINETDGHGFTPLHWAVRQNRVTFMDWYLSRGARVDLVNMGGDAPLHIAAAHGHNLVVKKLIAQRADINLVNEHGNSPLHYACFWNFVDVAKQIVMHGGLIGQCNKYGETPLDRSKSDLATVLADIAAQGGQDLKKIAYEESAAMSAIKHPKISIAAVVERGPEIHFNELKVSEKISSSPFGVLFKGVFQGIPIVAKKLHVKKLHNPVDFLTEFPHLRIFSHTNVMPVLGAVCDPVNLYTVMQFMDFGSLHDIIHTNTSGITLDFARTVLFSKNIAQGMAFLHSLDSPIARLDLCPSHIMIDNDLIAKINLGSVRFSFQDNTKIYRPQYKSPEALQYRAEDLNFRAADMYSFAIIFWEMVTKQLPFEGLTPLEIGMKIALENKRPAIPENLATSVSRFLGILWNREPAKRPSFEKIVPILDKMH